MTDAEIDAAVADAKQCTEPNTRGDGPKYIIAGATMWPTLAAHVLALGAECKAKDERFAKMVEFQGELRKDLVSELRADRDAARAEVEALRKQVATLTDERDIARARHAEAATAWLRVKP